MILIIDDDAAVRSSLTFLLKRAGFRPEAVPGPKEALEVVRATAPGNGGNGIMRFAVGFRKDKCFLVRVAPPSFQNFV